jgi:L-lactate dehydrogenase
MDWLARECRNNPPARAGQPPRLPGQRGLALRRQGLQAGVPLAAGIVATLSTWADKLGVAMPQAIARRD